MSEGQSFKWSIATTLNMVHNIKNTIKDGGSTALQAVHTVDSVYTVNTVDIVCTVKSTVLTLLLLMKLFYIAKRVACMPIYILREGSNRTLLELADALLSKKWE